MTKSKLLGAASPLAILIGSDKGGVGKDVVTEGINLAAQKQGLPATLIELESAPRLSLLYPEATTIHINAPAPGELYANPDIVYAPLDRASALWTAEPLSITSLGANVTSAVLDWSRDNAGMLRDGEGMTVVIVLAMGRAALSAGLSNLYETGVRLPKARRIAVLNDIQAAFLPGDPLLARRLEEARGDGMPIETISIPRMAAPIWGYAQNMGTLDEIAELDPAKLLALGLPEGPVRRSLPMINDWVNQQLVRPLSVLLPATSKAKARA